MMSLTSQILTFMPASTRPLGSQNAMNSRASASAGRTPRRGQHDPAGRDGRNSRSGTRSKAVLTGIGPVQPVINEAPECWVPAFQAKTALAPGGQLSAGQRIPAIPQRPLGRDVWAWATALRLDKVTAGSRLGQRLAGRDHVIGPGPRRLARRHGIQIRPRAASAAEKTVTFADGSAAEFDAVVWATGFTADHSWIDIPEAKDDQGRILHQRGVTPAPGLYMLGRTWQHTRGSALLGWVGSDAAFLAAQIGRR